MKEDLDLRGDRYEWLLSVFYVTYIVSLSASLNVGRHGADLRSFSNGVRYCGRYFQRIDMLPAV